MNTGKPRFRLPLTPEEAYRLLGACYQGAVEDRYGVCKFSEFTLDKIWQLSLCLTAEKPKLGVVLSGTVGNGKTTMVQAMKKAVDQLSNAGMFKVNGRYVTYGLRIITAKDFCNLAKSESLDYKELRDVDLLALDEFGEEPRVSKAWGNDISPVIDLIEHRYNEQKFTIFTTNLPPKSFDQEYGVRVADRLREMVTVINFGKEKSYRQ